MRTLRIVLPLLFAVVLLPTQVDAAPPYPTGTSSQVHEDMEFTLVLPSDYEPGGKYALFIVLHGMNGKAANLASGFSALTREGFVVCAPQSASQGWDQPNVKRAKKVLAHLIDVLAIDEKRLHGAAISQGCGSLASIVFDKRFHFISASWGMGGSSGGKVPGRARKEMGVIVLVGSEDWARGTAEGTVSQLKKKVRSVECHVQMGLGHVFPSKLDPYHRYWLKMMNGRFVPGECGFFEWTSDLAAAKATMAGEKRGGLLYFYSKKDAENAEARRVQTEVFLDHHVMHFGRQAVAVTLEREKHEELFASLGLTATPAVVVVKPDFTATKVLEGKKVKASALGRALRGVARDRKMPDKPGIFLHR